MQYFGGKSRIAKQILSYINSHITSDQPYWEPFCGSCWVISQVLGHRRRIASDKHPDLILLWKDLQNGWIPPDHIPEELYKSLQKENAFSSLRGFVGFGCSYSGKWFGGYARSSNRNYALNAKRSLLKKIKNMESVEFYCSDYKEFSVPENCFIYCDPPYADTTKYHKQDFDHEIFWEWSRMLSNIGHHVLISEYSAPDDFRCVLEIVTKTDIRNRNQEKLTRVEKLFVYGDQ